MSTVSSTSSVLQQAAQSILSGVTNSQLDVNTLVSALVTGATAAQAQSIAIAANSDNTQLSALGTMQSSLSNLLNSLGGLADGTAFTQLSATMSGSGITATTSTGAAAGTYSIGVQQIATANQISSKAYASGATLGTGNLNIGVGSGSMTIALTSSNNTLAGVASAINSASNNPGVTASVVTATDGQHLVLTSTKTGAANTVTVSADPTVDSGMATANFAQVTAGQDAKLTISGNTVTSASNTVTSALSGVTLSLTSAAVGTTQSLSVATNTSSITTTLQNFTTAYNAWVSTVKSLSSYDATSHAAGPLLGDAMLNSAVNGIASIMASGVSVGGTTYSLAQLGVNLKNDGTISLDSTALQSTLASSPSMVSNTFNTTNGIGEQLSSFISSYTTAVTGQIAQRNTTLQSDLTAQQQAQSSLAAYQANLTSQYQAEFTQLNKIMSQTQNNTTYLNQLFGGNGSAGTLNKSS